MCSPLSNLLSSYDDARANKALENRLVEVFKPIGTFKDGILTCPLQVDSELTVVGIDENGVLIFTSLIHKNPIIMCEGVEVTINFNLRRIALNSVRDVKIVYLALNIH